MRKSSIFAAALGLVLIVVVGVSWAQQQRETSSCTWENAEAHTLRTIERSRGLLDDHCVRVYAELDGWKLSARDRSDGVAGREYFVGAYAHDESVLEAYSDHPRRVEVLGRVGACAAICGGGESTDAEGNTVICMPVGYCHYHSDSYVMIDAVR